MMWIWLSIAQTTAGFTGADLENLMNESAICAAKDNRPYITQTDIRKSFVKVGIGAGKEKPCYFYEKRRSLRLTTKQVMQFYSICFLMWGAVYSVSIIPTGMGAGGYTMPLPEKDEMYLTKSKMLQDITVALARPRSGGDYFRRRDNRRLK